MASGGAADDLAGGADPADVVARVPGATDGASSRAGGLADLLTVQVRVKEGSDRERFAVVAAVVERCRDAGVSCIVDDRADFAVAVGADGVHVGAEDLAVPHVRRVVGPDLVVGATARNPAMARRLVAAGADYLGVGPIFGSTTKVGLPSPLGPDGLRAVVEAVAVPVVAIAGVTLDRVPEVLATGAWGVAVIGAVADADDPRAATAALLEAVAAVPVPTSRPLHRRPGRSALEPTAPPATMATRPEGVPR